MPTVNIDNRTTVSIGIFLAVASIIVWGANVNAQVQQNTKDIAVILEKIDSLNTNLTTTNGNIIELSTLLKQKQEN